MSPDISAAVSSHFAYGENCFTFLLFRAIVDAEPETRRRALNVLLSRLKPIITPQTRTPSVEVPDLWLSWLFPNFGKRHGFGEPDAVLFVGDHTFWFEVETRVHLRRRIPAFEQSLLQMVRFRLFVNAVARHWRRDRVSGVTLNDKGTPRRAAVRRANHPVLKHAAFRGAVKRAYEAGTDHYVLLSKSKPLGISRNDARAIAKRVLERHHQVLREWLQNTDEMKDQEGDYGGLPQERFWRIAWEGDLKRHLIHTLGFDPVNRGGFIFK